MSTARYTPEPGIYHDVAWSTYASWDAVNGSMLGHAARSMQHLHHYLNSGDRDTGDYAFGRLVHTLTYEPHMVEQRYAVKPDVDGRTKDGKAAKADFQAQLQLGREGVAAEDLATATNIAAAVRADPWVANLLGATFDDGAPLVQYEVSIVWVDADTKLTCKARIDIMSVVGDDVWVADLKTTRSAAYTRFRWDARDYHYPLRAAHYLAGLDAVDGLARRRWMWIAAEKTAPFAVKCWEFSSRDREEAEITRRLLLQEIRRARETGQWPGYGPPEVLWLGTKGGPNGSVSEATTAA